MIGLELIASLLCAVHGELYLEIDRCLDAPVSEVQRLLELELDVALVPSPRSGVPRASIRCEGSRALLTFETATRVVDLMAVDPRARPRLLALALAELATGPIGKQSAQRAETGGRASPDRVRTSTPAPSLHFAASALGGLTLFTSKAPLLFGGRASLELAPSSFGGRLDLGAYYGSKNVDLGDVSLLTASLGLSGFGRFVRDIVVFDVGAGLRTGYARIRGTPRETGFEGARVTGVWVGAFLEARASFRFGSFSIETAVEGGLVVRPITGNFEGRPLVAADGAWLGLHLGVGLAP